MSTAEAKMIVSAEDHASGPLEKIQARFAAMLSPIERVKASINGISGGGLSHLGGALDGVKGKFAAIGLGAGAAVTGVMAIKGAFSAVAETAEKAFDIKNLSKRFQIGTDELQVMQKVAKETGATTEELAGAFSQLKRRMGDAMGDEKKAEAMNKTFEQLGMTLKEAQRMSSTDLFAKVGQTFAAATGIQKDGKSQVDVDKASELKESIAKNLFGKAGVQDLAGIEKFGKDYKEIVKGMTEAGLLLTPHMIEMGAKAHESYEKSQGAMKGIKTMFGIEMMPVFDQFSQVMKDRMVANRTAMMPGVKALAGVLSTAIKPFLDDMDGMANKASGLFNIIAKFAKLVGWDNLIFGGLALIALPFVVSIGTAVFAISGLIASMFATAYAAASSFIPAMLSSGVAAARSAVLVVAMNGPLGALRLAFMAAAGGVRTMSLALLASPIGMLVAGIAIAALLIYKNWDGVASFFGGIWESISVGLNGVFAVFGPTWDAIKSAVSPVFDWFKSFFGDSSTGMQDWSAAGVSAGSAIIETLKALMLPLTLAIDAFRLLGAAWDFVTGKEVKFKSATAEMYAVKPNEIIEAAKAGTTPAGIASSRATLRGMENGTSDRAAHGGANSGIAPDVAARSQPIVSQKVDFAGKLDIRVNSEGRADVVGMATTNPNVKMTTNTGAMNN